MNDFKRAITLSIAFGLVIGGIFGFLYQIPMVQSYSSPDLQVMDSGLYRSYLEGRSTHKPDAYKYNFEVAGGVAVVVIGLSLIYFISLVNYTDRVKGIAKNLYSLLKKRKKLYLTSIGLSVLVGVFYSYFTFEADSDYYFSTHGVSGYTFLEAFVNPGFFFQDFTLWRDTFFYFNYRVAGIVFLTTWLIGVVVLRIFEYRKEKKALV